MDPPRTRRSHAVPVEPGAEWVDDIAPWDMVLLGCGTPTADGFDELPLSGEETDVTATDVSLATRQRAPTPPRSRRLRVAPVVPPGGRARSKRVWARPPKDHGSSRK